MSIIKRFSSFKGRIQFMFSNRGICKEKNCWIQNSGYLTFYNVCITAQEYFLVGRDKTKNIFIRTLEQTDCKSPQRVFIDLFAWKNFIKNGEQFF